MTDQLQHKNKPRILPDHDNPSILANNFSQFFKDKIDKISQSFTQDSTHNSSLPPPDITDSVLTELSPVSEEQVEKVIMSGNSKSCILDPIPTTILKSCTKPLLPVITNIVNQSITSSSFPHQFKTANVVPILKKPSLDKNTLSNYRPVSNLPYIGKIIEKIVVAQLTDYMQTHQLDQKLQSAYKKRHSTETAIVKIVNDLLLSLDNDSCVLLVLLDLSAAFDTVDHTLLLDRFEQCYGIKAGAKEWLLSYFSSRQQVIRIGKTESDPKALLTGMPQGSVLGPFSFPAYTSPLFKIADKHECNIHMYADDTQFYMSFKLHETNSTIAKMEKCIEEVRHWMSQNKLKLNDSKTEFLVISKKSRSKNVVNIASINIGPTIVPVVNNARNIGCIIDSNLNMEAQINSTIKNCYANLYNIARIRHCLTQEATATLVNAQITSRLDSFNSILYGIPDYQKHRLQLVQNNAARLVTGVRREDNISPVLKKFHWLPISFRIEYKITLLCFKALNNLAPQYLSDLLVPYHKERELRSSSQAKLDKPTTKLKTYGDRSFAYAAPTLWNKLPEHMRKIDKLDTFKRSLKTHMFDQAFKHIS